MARFHRAPSILSPTPDRFVASDGVMCVVCGNPAPRRVRREVAKMFPRLWRLATPHAHFPLCWLDGFVAAQRAHMGLHPLDTENDVYVSAE